MQLFENILLGKMLLRNEYLLGRLNQLVLFEYLRLRTAEFLSRQLFSFSVSKSAGYEIGMVPFKLAGIVLLCSLGQVGASGIACLRIRSWV